MTSIERPGYPRRYDTFDTKHYQAVTIIGATQTIHEMKVLWKRSRLGLLVRQVTDQLANNQVSVPLEISSTPLFENTSVCVFDTLSEGILWLDSNLMERIPGTPGKSGEKLMYIRMLQLVADYPDNHYLHTIQID